MRGTVKNDTSRVLKGASHMMLPTIVSRKRCTKMADRKPMTGHLAGDRHESGKTTALTTSQNSGICTQ